MRPTRKISENQGALPFQSRNTGGILAYALPWERRLVGALGALFIMFGILYIYFVTSSILNAAARQDLAGKVVAVKTAVSSLETQYFVATKGITESYALSLGYVAVAPQNQEFVQRNDALTLHDAP